MTALLISSVLLGLGGSLHCLGMCGPLVLRLHHGDMGASIGQTVVYHVARALTYGVMGLLIGLLGQGLYLMNVQQYLSILAGVVMLLIVWRPRLSVRWIPRWVQEFNTRNYKKFLQLPNYLKFPALGMLNALLPCGLVYTALGVAAVTASSPALGFLFMFVFGLGTLPALWALSLAGSRLDMRRWRGARWLLQGFTVVIAVLLIMRGLNLGIKYISPKQNTAQTELGDCCHKS